MSKRPPKVRQAILERLCWQVAERDDNLVAQAIYTREEIDAIYSLEEGALLDEFFDFLKQPDRWKSRQQRIGLNAVRVTRKSFPLAVCLSVRLRTASTRFPLYSPTSEDTSSASRSRAVWTSTVQL